MKKKLYKSRYDRIIFGVCGGIAEYFNINSLIIRIVFVVVLSFTRILPGIFMYAVLAAVMPIKPTMRFWQDDPYRDDARRESVKRDSDGKFDEFDSFDQIRKNADEVAKVSDIDKNL